MPSTSATTHMVDLPREAYEEIRLYLDGRERQRFERLLSEGHEFPGVSDPEASFRPFLEDLDTPVVRLAVHLYSLRGRQTTAEPMEALELPPEFDDIYINFAGLRGKPELTLQKTGYSFQITARGSRESADEVIDYIEAVFRKYPLHVNFEPETPSIFIGHGGDQQWRELRDALRDHHGFHVEAFETSPRAGHNIQTVLEQMMSRVNMALLVMTAADETTDGRKLARQNVVHEVGLLQSRLGWDRAIVLLEDGVEEPSNLAGTQQIRFRPGQIAGAVGEVVAEVNRRFPG